MRKYARETLLIIEASIYKKPKAWKCRVLPHEENAGDSANEVHENTLPDQVSPLPLELQQISFTFTVDLSDWTD